MLQREPPRAAPRPDAARRASRGQPRAHRGQARGTPTVPTEAREKDTLWSRALHYLQHRYAGRPYAGIVHRLDKDTSGAVVFARSRAALHALQERFREHAIEREYVALVEGHPGTPERWTRTSSASRAFAARSPARAAGPPGGHAIPHAREVHERGDGLGAPRDGTHAPDPRSPLGGGPPDPGRQSLRPRRCVKGAALAAPRQMLHARKLGFPHPESGRNVSAESPLPGDFAEGPRRRPPRHEKEDGPRRAGPRRSPRSKGSARRGR